MNINTMTSYTNFTITEVKLVDNNGNIVDVKPRQTVKSVVGFIKVCYPSISDKYFNLR